jgi:hypothetical protein
MFHSKFTPSSWHFKIWTVVLHSNHPVHIGNLLCIVVTAATVKKIYSAILMILSHKGLYAPKPR